mgnify:CR=1 FL=1
MLDTDVVTLVRDSVFGAQVHDEILAWLPSPDGTPD